MPLRGTARNASQECTAYALFKHEDTLYPAIWKHQFGQDSIKHITVTDGQAPRKESFTEKRTTLSFSVGLEWVFRGGNIHFQYMGSTHALNTASASSALYKPKFFF